MLHTHENVGITPKSEIFAVLFPACTRYSNLRRWAHHEGTLVAPQGALGPAEWTSTFVPLYNHYDVEEHSPELMNTSTLHYISISILNADQHLVAQRCTLLILDAEISLLVTTSASDIMPCVALRELFCQVWDVALAQTWSFTFFFL